MMLGSERFKKAKGENFHQKGQKVWLVGDRVSVKPRRGKKSFGQVEKDSLWPDMWVWVDMWNKEQYGKYFQERCKREKLKNFKKGIFKK